MSAPTYEVIDFHSHHVPAAFPVTAHWGESPEQRQRGAAINRLLPDVAALLALFDDGDLAGRVINTPPALIADANGGIPPDSVKRINDALAELVHRHPGSLQGLATIDAYDGERAATELIRAVKDLGLRGVFVESAKRDMLIDCAQARPTLAAAAELGIPVFLHPVNPEGLTEKLAPYGRSGTFLARGTINAAALIALLESGVFEENRGLHVVVTTLAIGGLLLAGGFGEGARLRNDTPSAERRHVYIDTMGFHPVLIRACVDLVGADHVLAGSDWPIVSDGPIKTRLHDALRAAGITPANQRLIASGNVRRLLQWARAAKAA
jgi:predicted TIM-barrel fold metal-dependent hydrolase